MNKLIITVITLSVFMFSSWAMAHAHKQAKPHSHTKVIPIRKNNTDPIVVSALPVLHALNEALIEGTPIQAIYLPAKRLPVSRISNWIQHKSGERIAQLAPITAVVTIESIWPEYALHKHLRSNNIAVIEIDAAVELLTGGARVRLSAADLENQTAFWMAPDNLLVMSQIMARDFLRIWPEYASAIKQNQQRLALAIGAFSLQMDQLLLAYNVENVCLKSDELMPLAQVTHLPVETSNCAAQSLTIVRFNKQQSPLKGLWQVDALDKPTKFDLYVWLKMNLQRLEQALSG